MSASPNPLRVAIVGAGPAGFYAADKLLKAPDLEVEVELFDRLPTPWGLVRAGVAPDHPNIKAVSRIYEKTAALPGFRFHGNVEVGTQISHDELLAHHHAVIYAVGAAGDRRLGIPGEDLGGSHGATEFVAWYNGHPDATDFAFDLQGERAVVIGNGNVALDVARILVLTREELAVTDIADHALEALAGSNISEVVVLGRRGPAQAAYTTPELKELGELSDADVVVDPAEATLDGASQVWLDSDAADKTARNNVRIVQEYAELEPSGKRKRVVLRYLVSPVELIGDDNGHVSAIRVVRNEPVPNDDGTVRAKATDVEEVIECSLVLRSIGYRGLPLEGVPFDDAAATIANAGGRVTDGGEPVPGVYTAGWIKRGPSGVIGTNKKCANETVALLLEDLAAGALPTPQGGAAELDALLDSRANGARVDYAAWERIDAFERAAGEAQGRPRVKLTRVDELLERGRS